MFGEVMYYKWAGASHHTLHRESKLTLYIKEIKRLITKSKSFTCTIKCS